jgi:hypothetical protein
MRGESYPQHDISPNYWLKLKNRPEFLSRDGICLNKAQLQFRYYWDYLRLRPRRRIYACAATLLSRRQVLTSLPGR